jgi:DNA-binding HxlR family transcriptional regulator
MKSYDQHCPVARALDVIGERWTLLILRDLFRHPSRRFQDLRESLAGIAPNTLSARLKSLEADGIIERRFYAEHPPRADYQLTDKGRTLGPVLRVLHRWGETIEGAGADT